MPLPLVTDESYFSFLHCKMPLILPSIFTYLTSFYTQMEANNVKINLITDIYVSRGGLELEEKFKKPKGAGEILDHTFSLSKSNFKNFFMVLLILMGPVYLLEAIIELVSGTSFFKESGSGSSFEQMLSSFNGDPQTVNPDSLGADSGILLVALLGFLVFPIAEAAILIAVNHIQKKEEYTVKMLIRQAFSRFWPILGSNLLFGLINFALFFIPIIIIAFMGYSLFEINMALGISAAIIISIGFLLGLALLIIRWSFYFAAVALEKKSPGLKRSWRLSRKRTWKLLGLYLVFLFITSALSAGVQMSFGILLGDSVLTSIISNVVSLVTTMFFTVGYAVMYFDLKIRHDADDLKEMIDDYNTTIV